MTDLTPEQQKARAQQHFAQRLAASADTVNMKVGAQAIEGRSAGLIRSGQHSAQSIATPGYIGQERRVNGGEQAAQTRSLLLQRMSMQVAAQVAAEPEKAEAIAKAVSTYVDAVLSQPTESAQQSLID